MTAALGEYNVCILLGIDEKAVEEFQGQNLVDLSGVVSITLKVAQYNGLEPFSLNIWPAKTARIQQHFSHVASERFPIPDPKMEDLVPPKEETFKSERGKDMVYAGHPLGHPHVIGILRFKQEFEEAPVGRPKWVRVLLPGRGRSESAGARYFRR